MAIDYDGTLTLSIQVSDWDAAKAWYRDVLELTLQYEVPEIGWCEFETGAAGTTIGLTRVDAAAPGTGVTPTLGVADVDAARAALESRGVAFDGDTVTIEGMVKLAEFSDPDGNPLCLAQTLAGG